MDLKTKFNINSTIIPFMFGAYRFGLYAPDTTPWSVKHFNQKDLEMLKKTNCVKITLCDGIYGHTTIPIVQLTPTGLDFLRRNFVNFLIEKSLYYTYLAIKPCDLVNVKYDIKNTKDRRNISGIGGFHATMLDSGTYTVESIEKSSVILSDNMNLLYRVKLFENKSNLTLRADQLEDSETEMKKRFPKIKFKSVIKKLARVISNLTLAEMVDDLYDNEMFKSRLNGEL